MYSCDAYVYVCAYLEEEASDLGERSKLAPARRAEVRVVPHDVTAALRRHTWHASDLAVVEGRG